MTKKKVAIYPCDASVLPLIRYFTNLQDRYELSYCCVNPGCGIDSSDLSRLDGRKEMGILAHALTTDILKACDILLITPGDHKAASHSNCISVMEQALQYGVHVWCSMPIPDEKHCEFLKRYPDTFEYLPSENNVVWNDALDMSLMEQRTPIIFVGGVIPETGTFEIFLSLFVHLRSKGLKISGLGEPSYLNKLGLHSYQNTMASPQLTNDQKVVAIRDKLRSIERNEAPSAIVVELPGSLIKYNDAILTGFGIDAQIITQAVAGDCGIFCLTADCVDSRFVEMMSTYIKNRYGFPLDGIHASGTIIDGMLSSSRKKHQIFHTSPQYVSDKIRTYDGDIPVYNLLDDSECERLADNIVALLNS